MLLVAPAVLWLACATAPQPEAPALPPARAAWCLGANYVPREGDLIFFTYHKFVWHLIFRMGHSGPPFHVGIVVRMPDGCLKLLEAGSLAPDRVAVVEVGPRLTQYAGDVWVRRLHQPLTCEQSTELTDFALEQVGRRFAKVRVGLEAVSAAYPQCGALPRVWAAAHQSPFLVLLRNGRRRRDSHWLTAVLLLRSAHAVSARPLP